MAIVGTPTAEQTEAMAATSVAAMMEGTAVLALPDGEAPSEETAAAVMELAQTWIECRNSGDVLYRFAVYTDTFLADVAARYGPIPPQFMMQEGRVVEVLPEALRASIADVRSMVQLSDGRVVMELAVVDPLIAGVRIESVIGGAAPATPVNELSSEELEVQVVLVAAEVNGRWLVDGLQYGDEPFLGSPLPSE